MRATTFQEAGNCHLLFSLSLSMGRCWHINLTRFLMIFPVSAFNHKLCFTLIVNGFAIFSSVLCQSVYRFTHLSTSPNHFRLFELFFRRKTQILWYFSYCGTTSGKIMEELVIYSNMSSRDWEIISTESAIYVGMFVWSSPISSFAWKEVWEVQELFANLCHLGTIFRVQAFLFNHFAAMQATTVAGKLSFGEILGLSFTIRLSFYFMS